MHLLQVYSGESELCIHGVLIYSVCTHAQKKNFPEQCVIAVINFNTVSHTKDASPSTDTGTKACSPPTPRVLPQDVGVIRADDPGGSNTFSEEEELRSCFMPFKSRHMRTGEQVGLGALTQLPFLHSACLVLQFAGLWKHTLLIFVFLFRLPQSKNA